MLHERLLLHYVRTLTQCMCASVFDLLCLRNVCNTLTARPSHWLSRSVNGIVPIERQYTITLGVTLVSGHLARLSGTFDPSSPRTIQFLFYCYPHVLTNMEVPPLCSSNLCVEQPVDSSGCEFSGSLQHAPESTCAECHFCPKDGFSPHMLPSIAFLT